MFSNWLPVATFFYHLVCPNPQLFFCLGTCDNLHSVPNLFLYLNLSKLQICDYVERVHSFRYSNYVINLVITGMTLLVK